MLAGQVADLLLGEFDAGEVLGAADQQGIAEQQAVLGPANRDDVGVANCFRGRNAQRGNGIGEARASTWTSRSSSCAWSMNSAIAAGCHTRPFSVVWVMLTIRGCEWWTSPRRRTARSSRAGSMKPSSLGRAVSVAPDSRTGPPASSSSEWAMSLHRISCHGRTAALSAMMLAAVPVNANSTSACGESKTARRRSVARRVTGSVPYDGQGRRWRRQWLPVPSDAPGRHCRRRTRRTRHRARPS